jgi:hypothetical protein
LLAQFFPFFENLLFLDVKRLAGRFNILIQSLEAISFDVLIISLLSEEPLSLLQPAGHLVFVKNHLIFLVSGPNIFLVPTISTINKVAHASPDQNIIQQSILALNLQNFNQKTQKYLPKTDNCLKLA